MEEFFAYDDELRKSGHFRRWGIAAKRPPRRYAAVPDGKVLVTDGPFAETKEQLGGIFVLEAKDMNQAIELMSKHPGLRLGGPFEIRAGRRGV